MSFSIVLTKRANEDLREILDYYDEQSAGATQSFLKEFIASIDWLSEHPNSCAVSFAKVRKKVMLRFPYNIYFTIKERKKEVIVARIWHQRRNPKSFSLR